MELKEAVVEGKVVKVGDVVGVKADFETYGEILKISMNDWGVTVLQLFNIDGDFYGDQQIMDGVPENRVWIL